MNDRISKEFPFRSNFIDVKGSEMHYIDEGIGAPILFIHGNPTSSYIWRNIIPYLSQNARCIAPDLIGMGQSGKPKSNYQFLDHYEYLKAFIERLGLKQISLVMHDWGSALGFHYARKHSNNIKGMAFMEGIFKTNNWSDFEKEQKIGFKIMRAPVLGWLMVNVQQVFTRKILPEMVLRPLSKEELLVYAAPYPNIKSRNPLRMWTKAIPIDGQPQDTFLIIETYHNWLKTTRIPKLCFYAEPGFIIKKKDVLWLMDNFEDIELIPLGKGLHFLQEDHPHKIGIDLAKWYKRISTL